MKKFRNNETRDIVINDYPTNIIVWVNSTCINIDIDSWQEFTLEENVSAAIDDINAMLEDSLNETETKFITEKLNIIFGN